MNIENMQRAAGYLASIPASQWNLDKFKDKDTGQCCALGHLTEAEMFGLRWKITRYTISPFLPTQKGASPFDAAHLLFQLSESPNELTEELRLFESLQPVEKGLVKNGVNHKEIWFARLLRLLEQEGIPFEAIFDADVEEAVLAQADAATV